MYIKIPGYELTKVINEGLKFTIFQAISEKNNREKVLIKAIKDGLNTPKLIASLQHEAAISKKVNSPYVLKSFEFVQIENTSALIQEDSAGIPLSELLKQQKLDLRTILTIAIGIARGIGDIHQEFIIHKDIKPENIIITLPDTVKIIDFSIATLLSKEIKAIVRPESLEGSIHYISPEQTGRMNRTIDYRTDIYSFGVVLFEMLTGQLPFQSDDLMELVYMHIAKPVPRPNELNPAIPLVISEIVHKCMQKDPEERYYSAQGLCQDLERCLKQLDEKGSIDFFIPGSNEIYDRFNIPQKIYGRDKEINFLLKRLNQVFNLPAITLITGYTGIGKTSIVMELQGKGYFIIGNCEESKKNIPFNAFVLAIENLIHQLLLESDSNVEFWKKALSSSLGSSLSLLTGLIPDLEYLVGPQLKTENIDLSLNETRLLMTIINFIKVITDNLSHQMIIFLDDLHWADLPSLRLLFTLSTSDIIKNLQIIGSYRSDEINPKHPLIETINKIFKEGGNIETLEIAPLNINTINQIVAEVIHTDLEEAFPLASLVYKKTRGNPYFVNRFLNDLYKQELIKFNVNTKSWESDLENIKKISTTENVVNLIDKTLNSLSPATLKILKVAAVIGTNFDMRILCLVSGESKAHVAECLWEGMQEECILPLHTFYSLDILSTIDFENPYAIPMFKFQYNRIRNAVYDLIPNEEIQRLHIKIGKVLLEYSQNKDNPNLFLDMVDHLNYGINLISNEKDRAELALYNQIAGQSSFNVFAYSAAEKYFLSSINLLSENGWKDHYELTLTLYQQLAMSAHLAGKHGEALQILTQALRNCKTDIDRAKICLLQMEPLVSFSTLAEAFSKGKQALRYLGVTHFEMSDRRIDYELKFLKMRLGINKFKKIYNWPKAKDERTKLLSNIYSKMLVFALYLPSNDFLIIVIKALKAILSKGISPDDMTVFIGYTLYLINKNTNFKEAFSIGKTICDWGSDNMAEKASFLPRYLFLTRIASYGENYDKIINELKEQLRIATQFEQFWLNASTIYYAFAMINFVKGEYLEKIKKELIDNLNHYVKTHTAGFIYYQLRWRQIIRVLTQEVDDFEDESFYKWGFELGFFEDITIKEKDIPIIQFGDLAATIMIDFYKKRYERGIQKLRVALKKFQGYFPGDLNWHLIYFYGALCLAGYLKDFYNKNDFKLLKSFQKRFELLSQNGAGNYTAVYYLISAEIAFINQNIAEALELTDNAIRESKQTHNLNLESLAYEQAANYYKHQNKDLEQKLYLKNAFETYLRWGAKLKLKQLEKEYPDIVRGIIKKEPQVKREPAATTYGFTSVTTSTGKDEMAFQTFMKSAQALSEEIQLEKLVTKLMRLVIIEAGAEKAYLILSHKDQLVVEAEITKGQEIAQLLNQVPLDSKGHEMSLSVIHYVARSMKSVLLADAAKEGMFVRDPYILAYGTHSILCMPLIYQGKLTGVLYLENSLVKGAFTKENTSLLTLLSSQIAISIENARFYARLEDQVSERTAELSVKNNELTKTLEELKSTQDQLIESEKLTALKQLIAGIAHEINTPLGAVKASSENLQQAIEKLLEIFSEGSEDLEYSKLVSFIKIIKLFSLNSESHYSSREERVIRKELIDIYDKAGIPHYVEATELLMDMGLHEDISPILKSFGKDVITILNLAYNFKSLIKNNKNIQRAVEHASKIIFALKGYIQKDSSVAMAPAQLAEGMETVLTLYHHQLKQQIKVVRNYQEIPDILCRFNELNQVWTNLIHNAIHAMNHKGVLKIDILRQNNQAVIKIADSGTGIPEEVQAKIFTPFFSTKPKGEGSGLGLSISKKIIEAHGGTIEFVSSPAGTTFIVTLPLQPSTISANSAPLRM